MATKEKYEVKVKKIVVDTYIVEAWSAKQAREEWASLVLPPGATVADPISTETLKETRVSVKLVKEQKPEPAG